LEQVEVVVLDLQILHVLADRVVVDMEVLILVILLALALMEKVLVVEVVQNLPHKNLQLGVEVDVL
jgi:hypothetical protein